MIAVTIKAAIINGVRVDESLIESGLVELARESGLSRSEVHQMVLENAGARNAEGWVKAIAAVAESLKLTRPVASNGRDNMAGYVAEYERNFPAYAADGTRLALSDDSATPAAVELTAEQTEQEVAAIVSRDQGRPRPVLDVRKSAASVVPCRTVELSRDRQYDEPQRASLSQSDFDAYLVRLAQGKDGARALGLAQGPPDRTDVLDVGAPSDSDLDEQLVQPNQSADFGTLSQKAQQQLAAMAPAYRGALQGFIDAAASEDDASEAESLYESAADLARRFGLTTLRNELVQRAEAVRQASASYLNDPAAAQVASAGGVRAEVTRYSEMIQSGNRSTPPLSPAARAAARAASRPGHT
jgi:hypothetical protein